MILQEKQKKKGRNVAFTNPLATAEMFFMTTVNKEGSACTHSRTAAS